MKFLVWAPFRGRVGTIEAILEYVRILGQAGHSVTLLQVSDEWNTYRAQIESMPGYPTIETIFSWSWLKYVGKSNWLHRRDFFILAIIAAIKVRRIVTRTGADYIIAGLLTAPLLVLLGSKSRVKVIASIQGYPKFLLKDQGIYYRIENATRRYLWYRLYGKAYKIVTMTEHSRLRLMEALDLPGDKIECVPNPLIPILRKRYQGLCPLMDDQCDYFDIIFVGRLDEQKDPHLFLSTAEEFKMRARSERFFVFGDGPLKSAVCQRIDGKGAHVQLCGHVERPWRTIRRRSVLLYTARWDDPGHAIVEAMAFGIPVVMVERNSSHIELGRGGRAYIVKPNAKDIADALERACRPGEADDVIASARTYVHERFSDKAFLRFINETC